MCDRDSRKEGKMISCLLGTDLLTAVPEHGVGSPNLGGLGKSVSSWPGPRRLQGSMRLNDLVPAALIPEFLDRWLVPSGGTADSFSS